LPGAPVRRRLQMTQSAGKTIQSINSTRYFRSPGSRDTIRAPMFRRLPRMLRGEAFRNRDVEKLALNGPPQCWHNRAPSEPSGWYGTCGSSKVDFKYEDARFHWRTSIISTGKKLSVWAGRGHARTCDRGNAMNVPNLRRVGTIQAPPLRRALGVFDSGAGGVPFLQALQAPACHTRDFGYTGRYSPRLAYGSKPPEIGSRQFATGIADFLCGLGVEGLVGRAIRQSAVALFPGLRSDARVPGGAGIDPGGKPRPRVTRGGRPA